MQLHSLRNIYHCMHAYQHESLDSRASHEPHPSQACTSTFSSHVKFTCQKESRRRSAVLKLYLQVKCYRPTHKVLWLLYQILGDIILKAIKFNEIPYVFIQQVISKYVKLHNAFSEDSYGLCYYISRWCYQLTSVFFKHGWFEARDRDRTNSWRTRSNFI